MKSRRDPAISRLVLAAVRYFPSVHFHLMNRFLCLVLLSGFLFWNPWLAWGQEDTQIGGTIGFNLATMEAPDRDLGIRPSYAVGLVLRQQLFRPLSLQSELLLNQKGAAIEADGGGSIRYGAAYLDLPVLVHVTGPTLQTVTLHAEAGGFGGVKLFEQQRPGGGGLNFPLRTGETFFHRFDAGVVAGAGATFALGERRLNLTARYSRGLVDVAQNLEEQPLPAAPFPQEAQARTWSLLVRLGL